MSSHPLPRNPNLFFLYQLLEQARHWQEAASTEADMAYIAQLILELEIKINEMTLVISYLDHCYKLDYKK
jgi:hypothetical protein